MSALARYIFPHNWHSGTGYGQEDDQRGARAAGFDAHLVKPVDANTLSSVLARLLDDEA